MMEKLTKTINVRKIFREINKRIKENGNILINIGGDERKGMSYYRFKPLKFNDGKKEN